MQYNPDFIAHRSILSDADKRGLRELALAYPLSRLRADARNTEELTVDFVYQICAVKPRH